MSRVTDTVFNIATKATIRGRTYPSQLNLSLMEVNTPGNSWVAEQLKILQTRSESQRLLRSEISSYLTVIKMLAISDEAHRLLCLPAKKMGRKAFYQLFTIVEQRLALSGRTAESCSKMSSSFRKHVFTCAEEQTFLDAEISRRSIGYQTKLNQRTPPRALISDFTDKSLDPELAAPISALAHVDAKDLMTKTELRLERDLVIIQQACIRELEICQSLRGKLVELRQKTCSKRILNVVAEMLAADKNPPKATQVVVDALPTNVLFTAYQKIIAREELARLNRPYSPVFWKNIFRLEELLSDKEKHLAGAGRRIHYLPYRMISQELVASFVLLLTYTGWNGATLQGLGSDDVVVDGDWVILKGYKGKTDSFVDDIYLDIKQPGVMMAINLIRWNRTQLVKLGFLPKTSKFLWCTWTSGYRLIEHQYVGFQDGLEKLQKQYSLPAFSLDQVRPQVLAHASLRTKNPEYVRQLASHKSLATTGHYLDQILMRNLNSAINLEFQRRLENTVLFRLSEIDSSFESQVRMKHVDLRLLTPLGDGASCIDPEVPPYESYLAGNLCDGNRCHIGGGCQNRKIVIDLENLTALVRKRRYYRLNWRRLEHSNSQAFEKFHVPAILFTLGLYDYIKGGSFRHYLERIEREIENEKK